MRSRFRESPSRVLTNAASEQAAAIPETRVCAVRAEEVWSPGPECARDSEAEVLRPDAGREARTSPRAGGMDSNSIHDARIAVVDDEAANVQLLQRILELEGYTEVSGYTDPREFLETCRILPPDLVLLDVMMPEVNGFEVLQRFRGSVDDFEYRPVMIVTSDDDRDTKQRALSSGARDFLAKPVSPVEVRLRVGNLLHTRSLQLELQRHAERLEERVRSRTAQLDEARLEILERLALAAEYRDDATGEHTRRVGRECAALAEALGLPADQVEHIRRAAPLHDVGKIALPDSILLKQGSLSADETKKMREHTTIGASILSGSRFPMMRIAEEIALHHHECWDGSGYPDGLKGDRIPLVARIVSVVDVFDSLTHWRVYKRAWTTDEALDEIQRLAGSKFDPEVAEVFLRMHGRNPPEEVSGTDPRDEEGLE